MTTRSFYIVTRNGGVIPALTARTERQAYEALGRWLMPIDVVLDDSVLVEIGRQAAGGVNPFRVQRADLSW